MPSKPLTLADRELLENLKNPTQPFICFHKWSRWSEPKKEYDNIYQGSVCVKCGKSKYRSIILSNFASTVMKAAYVKIFGDTNNE